jgi:hypothetical protein
VVGWVGQPGRVSVPEGWRILGASRDVVVAAEPAAAEAVIHFIALDGSETFARATWPGDLFVGQVAGGHVFASGASPGSTDDPGIAAIDLSNGAVAPLVAPGSVRVDRSPVTRNVVVSESGHTIASSLCAPDGCIATSIWIDGSPDPRVTITDPRSAMAVSDGYVLLADPGEVPPRLSLLDLGNQATTWALDTGSYLPSYLAGDAVIALEIDEGQSPAQRLLRVTPDGAVEDLHLPAAAGTWFLWAALSSSSTAILGNNEPFPIAGAQAKIAASSVDLVSGRFTEAGLVIPTQ